MSDEFIITPLVEAEEKYGMFPYTQYINKETIIAGGAVRDWIAKSKEEPTDVDLFYKLGNRPDDVTIDHDNIHLVCMKYNNVEELLQSFDFTINQCAIYMNEIGIPILILHALTKFDIINKCLCYCHSTTGTHPIHHVKRIGKFIAKGYTISNNAIFDMCKAAVDAGQDNMEEDYDDETTDWPE